MINILVKFTFAVLLFSNPSTFISTARANEAEVDVTSISSERKKKWLNEIQACSEDCAKKSIDIMKVIYRIDEGSKWRHLPAAEKTILYLHSYTLFPDELHRFKTTYFFDSNVNYFAPSFSAHTRTSTAEDFLKATAEDWILDADLALHLAYALGKPVVVQGFSMGGMAAIGLAQRFPEKVSQLVLMAPALLVAKGGEEIACLGRLGVVQSLVGKLFSEETGAKKFLGGACSLAKMISTIRDPHGISIPFYSEGNDSENKIYLEKIENIQSLAEKINIPTLLIYAERDGLVDAGALQVFSKNLKNGKTISFKAPAGEPPHISILHDPDLALGETVMTVSEQIKLFIHAR